MLTSDHPDREQFCQYEQQWQQYETQMLEKQAEIRQRKEQKIKSLQPNPQTAPRLTLPSFQQPENILRGQPPSSFANRQMHEIRPTLSQPLPVAPQHPQRWNQPGGKGDQVNFGQDINQRFQSTGDPPCPDCLCHINRCYYHFFALLCDCQMPDH